MDGPIDKVIAICLDESWLWTQHFQLTLIKVSILFLSMIMDCFDRLVFFVFQFVPYYLQVMWGMFS
jgi:hypothetical protein